MQRGHLCGNRSGLKHKVHKCIDMNFSMIYAVFLIRKQNQMGKMKEF